MPLADYQQLVDDLVRDRENVVSADQRDNAIAGALAKYSADWPRTVVVDAGSAGGQRIDLPAGFTEDSELVAVEYPIGEIPARELPLSEVSIYRAPTVRQLQLPISTNDGDSLRVSYTAAHLLDDVDDTVPAKHRQAVASLAASIVCGELASWYASESDPAISADTVNRSTKSATWRARSKDLAGVYDSVVGAPQSERTKPASVTVELPSRDAHGHSRLFHPPRGRLTRP